MISEKRAHYLGVWVYKGEAVFVTAIEMQELVEFVFQYGRVPGRQSILGFDEFEGNVCQPCTPGFRAVQ